MKVLIRYTQDRYEQTTDTIEIPDAHISVNALKKLIEEKYQIESSMQRLTVMLYNSHLVTMTNEWPLSFFTITNYSIIFLETINKYDYDNHKQKHSQFSSQSHTKKKYLSSLQTHQKQKQKQNQSMGIIIESANEYNDELFPLKHSNYTYTTEDIHQLILHSVKNHNLLQFKELVEQYSFTTLDLLGINGWNALQYASLNGFSDFVSELVHKHKCNPNITNREQWSPLHLASFKGHLDTVRILVGLEGIDVNMNIKDLGTPLHCACRKNHHKIITILLYKANRNIKDSKGKLPIEVTNDSYVRELLTKVNKEFNSKENSHICHKANLTTEEIDAYPFLMELEFIPPKPPKACGYVEKIGNLMPMFRMRYIEIDPLLGAFNRYKTYDDYPMSPNEVIPLIDVSLCGIDIDNKPLFSDSNDSYFSLFYLRKELYRVKSKEACMKWVDLINAGCIYAKFWKHVSQKYTKTTEYLMKQSSEMIVIDYLTGKVTKANKRFEGVKSKEKNKGNYNEDQLVNKICAIQQEPLFNIKDISIPNDKLIDDSSKKGITFESFELINSLGSGSFGQVFLVKLKSSYDKNSNYYNNNNRHHSYNSNHSIDSIAIDPSMSSIFAMKILNKKMLNRRQQLRYAITECNVLKQTNSPFIVTLHYSFQTMDYLYMILDYCPGGDLGIHLAIHTFEEDEARFYIAELVLAIEHLHDLNVIYRDLKPENILIASDGHIKLADFGLAKENMGDKDKARSFCGSPAYLTPEMVNRRGVGKSADIYGIGAVLYEMLNGQPPFYARDIRKLYNEISKCKLMLHEHFSTEVRDLLKQLLNRNPMKRIGIHDIKLHPFFAGIDWEKLGMRKIKPPIDLVKMKRNKEMLRKSSGSCNDEGDSSGVDGNRKEKIKFKDNDYGEDNKNVRRVKDFSFIRGNNH